MTEAEARDRARMLVPRETFARLERFGALLVDAARSQNLVSQSTLEQLWSRHILDSMQLHPFIAGGVVDVGSGAGLPGLVLAIIGARVALIEPRRLRVAFLASCIADLGLASVDLYAGTAESVRFRFDTITARAVAPLDRFFAMTVHMALPSSRWVLPKGRDVHRELEVAQSAWHGQFELVPSITDPSAMIVVAEQLRPKASR